MTTTTSTLELAAPPDVTARELTVLHLVGFRYSNAEIALKLGISKRTVESHVAALRQKFQASDRASLLVASRVLQEATQNSRRASQPRRYAALVVELSMQRRELAARRMAIQSSWAQHVRASADRVRTSALTLQRSETVLLRTRYALPETVDSGADASVVG